MPPQRSVAALKRSNSELLSTSDSGRSRKKLRLAAENREYLADIGRMICLLTLATSDSDAVEPCQLVSDSWPKEEIAKLEYVWGMRCDFNSRENLIALTPSLRSSFEQGQWVLVMDDSGRISYEIRKFTDRLDGDRYRTIEDAYKGQTSFRYRLLPLPSFQTIISRRDAPGQQDFATKHVYPYTSLPVLVLPIRPHFAIAHMGRALRQNNVTAAVFDDWGDPYDMQGFRFVAEYTEARYKSWMEIILPPIPAGDASEDLGKRKGPTFVGDGISPTDPDSLSCTSDAKTDRQLVAAVDEVAPSHSWSQCGSTEAPAAAAVGSTERINSTMYHDHDSSKDKAQLSISELGDLNCIRVEDWLKTVQQSLIPPTQ